MSDTLSPITFSGDASAPTGPAVPTAKEVQAMGVLGLDLDRGGRKTLMDQICLHVGIPMGGWHGQAVLFERGDIRLVGTLAKMAKPHTAKLIAGNLARAGRYVHGNLMLSLVIAQREGYRSLTATGTALVETYHGGGLDFLEREKAMLGLPRVITKHWQPVREFRNDETMNMVSPEEIPAHDQMLAYAATLSARFTHYVKTSLRAEFGDEAEPALASASRTAVLVWQAYAFLASGGNPYDPGKPLRQQLNQHFGQRSALGFYAQKARAEGRQPSLNDIVTDTSLDRLEWYHSAKTRAAEALFMERLLKRARELLPH